MRGRTTQSIHTACARIGEAAPGSLLVVDCEVPATLVTDALLAAGQRALRRILDLSFPARVNAEILRNIEAMTPNEPELRALQPLSGTDSDDLVDIARGLAARGSGIVCVKLEDGGCLHVSVHGHEHIPASREVRVVDTIGAGDAFTGAFAVALLEGRPSGEAARFGVAASSLTVTNYGSQPAYPDRHTLEALVRDEHEVGL